MKFKKGDRVSFLNETGGGIIKKILNSKTVAVETADGFELPTLITDLILSERNIVSKSEFYGDILDDEKTKAKKAAAQQAIQAEEYEEEYSERINSIVKMKRRNPVPEGIYLGFAPQNQMLFLSGAIDVYVFNNTHYDVLINLFLQDHESGSFYGQDYDAIPADSKLLLNSIEISDIERWSRGIMQMMVHTEKVDQLYKPMSATFNVKPNRFTREDNFKEYSLLEEKMFLFGLWEVEDFILLHPEGRKLKISGEDSVNGTAVHVKPKPFIARHQTGPGEAVVDLHIEAIAEDVKTMDKGQMLGFQVGYFTKCMESAFTNRFYKVTFIHGIGSGVLKNALIQVLKDYDGIQYQDAPMSNFGMGAIDVRFPSHKLR